MNDNKCRFQNYIIAYLEKTLNARAEQNFKSHFESCPACQEELAAVKKLYGVLDGDEVLMPEEGFFQQAKQKARQLEIPIRVSTLSRLAKILAPVFALLVVIVAVTFWPRPVVELTVPVANFMDNEDLNVLLIERIVDDKLISQLDDVEESFSSGINETIDELTNGEKIEFMNILSEKYHEAIL